MDRSKDECICGSRRHKSKWIMCDRCEQWFHLVCARVTEDDLDKIVKFCCYICTKRDGAMLTIFRCQACAGCMRQHDCDNCESCLADPKKKCNRRRCNLEKNDPYANVAPRVRARTTAATADVRARTTTATADVRTSTTTATADVRTNTTIAADVRTRTTTTAGHSARKSTVSSKESSPVKAKRPYKKRGRKPKAEAVASSSSRSTLNLISNYGREPNASRKAKQLEGPRPYYIGDDTESSASSEEESPKKKKPRTVPPTPSKPGPSTSSAEVPKVYKKRGRKPKSESQKLADGPPTLSLIQSTSNIEPSLLSTPSDSPPLLVPEIALPSDSKNSEPPLLSPAIVVKPAVVVKEKCKGCDKNARDNSEYCSNRCWYKKDTEHITSTKIILESQLRSGNFPNRIGYTNLTGVSNPTSSANPATAKLRSSTTSKPSSSTVSRPGSSTSSKPGSSTKSKPASSTAAKPGSSTASRTRTSAASKPGSSTAAKPSSSTASRTRTSAASKPGSSTAAKPSSSAASKPGSSAAAKPSSSAASKPGYIFAARPGSSIASKPSSSAASKPGYVFAARPGSSIASKPSSSAASKPGSSATSKPSSSTASKPGPSKPGYVVKKIAFNNSNKAPASSSTSVTKPIKGIAALKI